ncbi:hypothetical protein EL18_02114 [Nitratireductor basaltis]|uniref:Uncharacterized protein n=1 Tax=Nitratireductor basaltis TaxID=472175 RepID=A0A084UDN6_9HYPH|nr:hypothetical protein EL18_02114 [Nitratireductor basaltis]
MLDCLASQRIPTALLVSFLIALVVVTGAIESTVPIAAR